MKSAQVDACHPGRRDHRGTGFAGPLVAPPEGKAPQALRGGAS